jgi:hypothetical protein
MVKLPDPGALGQSPNLRGARSAQVDPKLLYYGRQAITEGATDMAKAVTRGGEAISRSMGVAGEALGRAAGGDVALGKTIREVGDEAGKATQRAGVAVSSAMEKSGDHWAKAIKEAGAADEKAFTALGTAFTKTAGDIVEFQLAQDRHAYSAAKGAFTIGKDNLDQEFERDRDYATMSDRYSARLNELRGEAGASVRNPAMRQRFDLDTGVTAASGVNRIKDHAFRVESDINRAGLDERLEGRLKAASREPDPAERAKILKDGQNDIASNVGKGYLNAEQGGRKARGWAEDYAEASVSRLPPEERLKVLEAPRGEDGRTNTEADFIPEARRKAMVREARSEIGVQTAGIKSRIEDDLTSYRNTGKGVDLDPGDVKKILGDNKFVEWQQKRVEAYETWSATHDLSSLPDAQLSARLAAVRPVPGAEGFARQQKLYDAVEEQIGQVRKFRREDPARSVHDDPNVRAATRALDPEKPETRRRLVETRMAAQERAGIPEDMRSPITKEEALALAEPLRRSLPGQEREVLTKIGKEFKEQFGPHAEAAFEYTLRAQRIDAEVAKTATRVMKKLAIGENPTKAEVRSLDTESEISAAVGAVNGKPATPQRAAMPPAVTAGMAAPARAIEALRKNPGLAADFDKKYGAGLAKKLLETYTNR